MSLTLGVDEAGRGPLIGPMIIAGAAFDQRGVETLRSIGVKDSKLLPHGQRILLYSKIVSAARKFKIVSVSPREIDEALNSANTNLNRLEMQVSAKIINGVSPDKVIVDCPDPNTVRYKTHLLGLIEDKKTKLIVEHKADVNYVECAAASILAKVKRELEIEKIKKETGDFGSGYPADQKTITFLDKNYDRHPEIFRKTWATYRKKLQARTGKHLTDY